MTEISLIVLGIAVIVGCFNHCKLAFEVKELKETVDSHWSAIQHECNAIWSNINVEEEEDYEGDGTEDNAAPEV